MKKLFYFLYLILFFVEDLKDQECTGVSNFKVNKIDINGIDTDVRLKIKDPNSIGFSIYKSEVDISFSGIHLGKAKIGKLIHIGTFQKIGTLLISNHEFKDIN